MYYKIKVLNRMSKMNLLQIVAKNVSLGVTDTLSVGMGSAISNSINEIRERAQQTNEALYYFQIATFLETVDLDQKEVNEFFEKNRDNLRLGIEIFKILEQTYIEQQSQMIARTFSLYVRGKIEKPKFDLLIHIITNLNQHLINTLEIYLPNDEIRIKEFDLLYESIGLDSIFGESERYSKEEISYDRKISSFLSTKEKEIPQELVNWGFYRKVDVPLTMDLEKLPSQMYEPTRFFLWFVTTIMKKEEK